MLLYGAKTKAVLQSIANHLNGREECRGLEYKVKISSGSDTYTDVIEVWPYLTVFPDTYRRKETDKRSVTYHVFLHHFPELLLASNSNDFQLKSGFLTKGTYVYKKQDLSKRRKWYKVEER